MGLNSMESILFKYYIISLKKSLKPLHVVHWALNPHTLGSLLMVMYGPLCGYMDIVMYMELYPMEFPSYVQEYFKEYFETLVVGGMVFGTVMCGVFDVLDILKNLRVSEHQFANNPIIERYSSSIHFR